MVPDVRVISSDKIIDETPINQNLELMPNFGILKPIVIQELPYEGFIDWLFSNRKYKVIDGGDGFKVAKANNKEKVVCTVFPVDYIFPLKE